MTARVAAALLAAVSWLVPQAAALAQEGSAPYYVPYQASATGMCRAATYSAGTGLRYRPIGIHNGGDTAVDVVCSYATKSVDGDDVQLSFYNYSAGAADVDCVFLSTSRDTPYGKTPRTRSVSVPAGGSAIMPRLGMGYGDYEFFNSISCRLPPGIEMGTIYATRFCYYGCRSFNQATRQVAATAACQPRSPLELGGLRIRPLGIFNNKPDAIYIACSFWTGAGGDMGQDELAVAFYNSTASAVDVTCTAQGGSRTAGANNYTGSISVPAGTSVQLLFPQIDRKAEYLTHVNLSCLLPGGIEMGQLTLAQVSPENDL